MLLGLQALSQDFPQLIRFEAYGYKGSCSVDDESPSAYLRALAYRVGFGAFGVLSLGL